MLRRLASPLGWLGGPLVGTALASLCRMVNGARGRPLTDDERRDAAALLPGVALDRVRLVEHAMLPIAAGFAAITLGHTIYVRGRLADHAAGLLAHELAHVRQFERLGRHRMFADYGALWLAHGYRAHPLEVEARAIERAGLALEGERRRARGTSPG
jgi:hypothetical protein